MLNNESKKKILTVKNYLKTFYDSVYELGTRMSEHKIFILAAGISFNILLYIIPLVLILVSFINIFIDPEEIVAVLEYAIENYIPNAQNYTDLLSHIIKEIEHLANSSKIAGIVGFFILLWISSSVISTLNTCISLIFKLEQPHYFKTKLKDLITTILLNILIILYGVLLPLIGFTNSLIQSIFHDTVGFLLSKATIIIANLIVSALFFYFIYWIIPSSTKKLNHQIAIWSTLIAVFAIEIARFLFTLYISSISNYSRFYGTYAVIVTLAVWLFYSCFIILFSAELSTFIWDKKKEKNKIIFDNSQYSNNKKINSKKKIK